ncbi:MAG: histidine phosphatase family protein [Wenzhouxiangella sp.]|nr:histidine phosphatase family protein [Wenzhouxiangella sp.]
MIRLFLIRHAKSSWTDPSLPDHDRPLNGRGRRQLDVMGRVIHASGAFAGPVFCSTALRARLTLDGLLDKAQPPLVTFDPALYTFDHQDLLDWLAEHDEERLTIIGHNPALEDLADSLLQPGPGHLPTCAFLAIELSGTSWRNPGLARLVRFETPRTQTEAT